MMQHTYTLALAGRRILSRTDSDGGSASKTGKSVLVNLSHTLSTAAAAATAAATANPRTRATASIHSDAQSSRLGQSESAPSSQGPTRAPSCASVHSRVQDEPPGSHQCLSTHGRSWKRGCSCDKHTPAWGEIPSGQNKPPPFGAVSRPVEVGGACLVPLLLTMRGETRSGSFGDPLQLQQPARLPVSSTTSSRSA